MSPLPAPTASASGYQAARVRLVDPSRHPELGPEGRAEAQVREGLFPLAERAAQGKRPPHALGSMGWQRCE
jgi:hypothetical protein